MKIIDKIDDFIGQIDEKKQKNILGKELKFLMATEEDEAMKEVLDRLIAEAKVGGAEYDDFFKSMLKKWKVKSYKELPKDKQAKFFNAVDKEWDSKVKKSGDKLKKYKKKNYE